MWESRSLPRLFLPSPQGGGFFLFENIFLKKYNRGTYDTDGCPLNLSIKNGEKYMKRISLLLPIVLLIASTCEPPSVPPSLDLKVDSTNPKNNATDIQPKQKLVVSFNHSVEPASLVVTLKNKKGFDVHFLKNLDKTGLNLEIEPEDLAANTEYEATIVSARSLLSYTLSKPYTWSFKTGREFTA